MTVSDETTYRVSDGVLVSPFGETAVAVDLVTEKAHVLGAASAWLLSQKSPVDIASLIADAPEDDREELTESILDALDTLRTPGLVDRETSYEPPVPPDDAGGPEPGGHVGRTHAVIDRRIAFRSDDEGLVQRIDAFLGDAVDEPATRFFDAVPRGDGSITLFAADEWRFSSEERLLFQLPTVLNDDGARTHGVVVIHSGTVRTPDGRVLVLTGPPSAGKSTLTAALLAAGCDYLGDESIGVTADGTVLGYPKPLTLSADSCEVLGIPELGGPHVPPETIRANVERVVTADGIDEILLVRFDPAAAGASDRHALEPVAALEAVLANVLNLARSGEAGLETICRLVESVPVRPFVHAGVETAVPQLLDP